MRNEPIGSGGAEPAIAGKKDKHTHKRTHTRYRLGSPWIRCSLLVLVKGLVRGIDSIRFDSIRFGSIRFDSAFGREDGATCLFSILYVGVRDLRYTVLPHNCEPKKFKKLKVMTIIEHG